MKKINIKKIHWLIILFVSILWLLIQNWSIKFEFWEFWQHWKITIQTQNNYNDPNFINKLQNISWYLIISPNSKNFDLRTNYIKSISNSNNWYLYWRIYQITYKKAKTFLKKLGENIKIKLILEDKKYKQYYNDFKKLSEYFSWFVILKNDHKLWVDYTHAKTFLWPKWFIIQTANLSYTSFYKNIEHFFYSDNQAISQNLLQIRKQDWNWQTITQIHPNLLICPLDCRYKIEYLLKNARSDIFLFQQYISDIQIQNILKNKIKQWLNVKILLPQKEENTILQNILWKQYIKLIKKPYIHSKTILIDKKYLIIWSMNMSSHSLNKNREIWIIITNQNTINKRLQNFKFYW